jgi:hypothetical protein
VRFIRAITILAASVSLTACDDDFGLGTWSVVPDTSLIYSASRPDLIRLPSAYDVVNLARVAIEGGGATGNWDFALLEQGGAFVLAPERVFTGSESRSGIARSSETTLEAVREAPGDTASYSRLPVPVQEGAIYILRSRRASCFTFGSGVYYAKLQAIEVDPVAGTLRFAVVRNPNCNDRALLPPEG